MTALFSQLHFGAPGWLWGLLLLPALAGLFLWAERRGEQRLARLIELPRLRVQLTTAASAGRRRLRFALLLGGLAGFLLAMASPQLDDEIRETHRRGLDLIVIVDVSKSMLATDLVPNRLTRAKLSVQDLVGHLNGDRLGLVAFAGSAFLQAPLTVAYDAVLDATAELDTDLIPKGGTNIGGAIDLALDAFGKAAAGNRAIVLLSDGEPTSDTDQANGLQAAARAAMAGVKIFTVGYGTTDGSLIPLDRNGHDFVRDENDKIVRTRLDEENLRAIAKAGGGFYTHFVSEDATMRAVVEQGVSQLKTGEIDARTERRPIERYQWPLAGGLVMLVLAAFVGERRKVRAPAMTNAAMRRTRETATVAAALAACLLVAAGPACRADDAPGGSPAASTADRALELYRQGHYDEAYQAFADMAKKNPDAGSLQFNAGASAYMGKQYDEALDAFGHALASDNPDLQAKSHYNFGNTLFRRGEEQKDRDAKIKDWKNALQHYDSTLDMLKRKGQDASSALASNTTYNRDLVQKRIDEEMKQPPQQQQQKQDKNKKDQQKQDQQQQQQGGQPQQQDQQKKQDQQQNQSQQNQQNPSQGQQKSDQQNQQQQSQQNPSDQLQQSQQQKQDQQQQQQGNQPPQGQDQQNQSSDGKNSDQKQPDRDANQPPPSSSPSAYSGMDQQPRQRGDFQSQPGGSPTPNPEGSPTPGEEPKEESGKMSEAQARALLDSLKGQDDHPVLTGRDDNRKKQDEPVTKDW